MYLKQGFAEVLCDNFPSTKIKLRMRDFAWYFLSSLNFWDDASVFSNSNKSLEY